MKTFKFGWATLNGKIAAAMPITHQVAGVELRLLSVVADAPADVAGRIHLVATARTGRLPVDIKLGIVARPEYSKGVLRLEDVQVTSTGLGAAGFGFNLDHAADGKLNDLVKSVLGGFKVAELADDRSAMSLVGATVHGLDVEPDGIVVRFDEVKLAAAAPSIAAASLRNARPWTLIATGFAVSVAVGAVVLAFH